MRSAKIWDAAGSRNACACEDSDAAAAGSTLLNLAATVTFGVRRVHECMPVDPGRAKGSYHLSQLSDFAIDCFVVIEMLGLAQLATEQLGRPVSELLRVAQTH